MWQYARDHGFAIVTLDSDFYDMSLIHSSPPKVVWLRLLYERCWIGHLVDIVTFLADATSGCLILRDD